jgi:16S rRNA (adenine1518-N6/adenine1519-N6)-dimethyltransferase
MLPTTSQLIKKYNIAAKKSLGQNFILDKNFTDKIVKSVVDIESSFVLEIGAGPGSLTRSILDAKVKKLIVIEKDPRCLELLREIQFFYGDHRLQIIEADAKKIDETILFPKGEKFKIVSNLPYNIGTSLIFKWLKILPNISSMNLMLQKEVVERIVAQAGEKNYGRLAVMINFLCQSKMLFSVNKSIFTPPPKVTSAIVEIIPKEKPLFDVEFEKLEVVVAAAFNQRRKMIKASLKSVFVNPVEILESCNIKPDLRAEKLSIIDFCKIAEKLN